MRGCLEGSKTWQAASRGIYTCWGRNWKSLVQFTQKTCCEINICWKSSLNLDTSLMKMLSNSGGHTACGLTADLGFQHLNPQFFHSCPALSSFSTSPAMCPWAPPVTYTLTQSPGLSGVTASRYWGFSRSEAYSHLLTLAPIPGHLENSPFHPCLEPQGSPGPRFASCFQRADRRDPY